MWENIWTTFRVLIFTLSSIKHHQRIEKHVQFYLANIYRMVDA
jgi:hypothetical protein